MVGGIIKNLFCLHIKTKAPEIAERIIHPSHHFLVLFVSTDNLDF